MTATQEREMRDNLSVLALRLSVANPDLTVCSDQFAVWVAVDGTDYGAYCAIFDGRVLSCIGEDGAIKTTLHEPHKPDRGMWLRGGACINPEVLG